MGGRHAPQICMWGEGGLPTVGSRQGAEHFLVGGLGCGCTQDGWGGAGGGGTVAGALQGANGECWGGFSSSHSTPHPVPLLPTLLLPTLSCEKAKVLPFKDSKEFDR